jgi:hypothetical protein
MPPLIYAAPGALKEGLFGGIFLHVFEVLPYLHARQIYPAWDIASLLYGRSPGYTVIPGLLDLSYTPPETQHRVDIAWLRDRHCAVLGGDWPALQRLWQAYFSIPSRYVERLQPLGELSHALGVHYRGNDKVSVAWDSNPITHADFFLVVQDFLRTRPHLQKLFVATDDKGFLDYVKQHCALPVVDLGGGAHHFTQKSDDARWQEAELAIVDAVALSRCGAVVNTSSALSAFAKVLRPELEIYRCAASKMFSDIPYFPIAYVPVHTSSDPQVQALIDRMMQGDWTQRREAEPFKSPFFFRMRRIGRRQRLRNARQTLRVWWRRLQPG